MDTTNNGPLIAAGGGLLLFISLFLSWGGDFNAWETFDISDILLAAIALLAVAVGVGMATGNPINLPGGSGALYTAGVFSFAIMAFLILEAEDRKFGLFLGLLGTIGIIVGALQLTRGPASPAPPRERAADPTPPPPPPPAGPTV